MKSFLALVAAYLIIFPAMAFLDPAQIQIKTINIPTAREESKITIKESWDHPDLERLRTGDNVYRAAPVLVPGSSWLSYVSQSAIGSWIGSYAPMAIQ